MGSLAARAVVLSLVALGLLGYALQADWIVVGATGATDVDHLGIGLHSITVCGRGVCAEVTGDRIPFPMSATASFGLCALVGVAILIQGGSRAFGRVGSKWVSFIGYLVAAMAAFAVVMFAYIVAHDTGEFRGAGIEVTIERTWAAAAALVGLLVGMFALYYGSADDAYDAMPARPDAAAARPAPTPYVPSAVARRREVPDSLPLESAPVPDEPSQPVSVGDNSLRGKLQFAMHSAELSRAGIDARREDSTSVLVTWNEVVGLVARTYQDVAIVDIVSRPGSALRLVPWTRISGEPLEGDGEQRVRNFIALVSRHCPELRLDKQTQDFVERRARLEPLTDDRALADHDARLG